MLKIDQENKTVNFQANKRLQEILCLESNHKETRIYMCGFSDPRIYIYNLILSKFKSNMSL